MLYVQHLCVCMFPIHYTLPLCVYIYLIQLVHNISAALCRISTCIIKSVHILYLCVYMYLIQSVHNISAALCRISTCIIKSVYILYLCVYMYHYISTHTLPVCGHEYNYNSFCIQCPCMCTMLVCYLVTH